MKKSDIGVIAVLYLIGAAFLAMSLQLPEGAQAYPLFLTTLLLGLTTLYLVVQVFKYAKTKAIENDIQKQFGEFLPVQFFGVLFLGCAYLAGMYFCGYYIASLAFLLICMLFLKVKPLYIAIATAFLMMLVFLVFTEFLKVPLPVGVLFG